MDEVNYVVDSTKWMGFVVAGVVTGGFWLAFAFWSYLQYRIRRDLQLTIRAAIENRQELTPELLAQLGVTSRFSKESDFRKGILTTAVGVGMIVLGLLHGDDDFRQSVTPVGVFVLTIGLAFLGLWRFNRGNQR